MTPWLSEPLLRACSNLLIPAASVESEFITQPYTLKIRRRSLRITLLIVAALSCVMLPIWAIAASSSVPASNQYCMSTSVIGALFASTLGTNMIYLWLNSCLARKAAYAPNKQSAKTSFCMVHSRALQIVRDMKAVCEIKDQFTLADVLPSSLEISYAGDSHHSRSAHSQQHSHHNSINNIRLPPINEKTEDNLENQAEMIDEI